MAGVIRGGIDDVGATRRKDDFGAVDRSHLLLAPLALSLFMNTSNALVDSVPFGYQFLYQFAVPSS